MKRVVIADGSAFVRIMLSTALQKLGFEIVELAKDGMEAVDKCCELKPDILIIGLELEGMNGIEVTKAISSEDAATTVIMLVSDSEDISDRVVDAVKAGVMGFMRKPLTEEEIKARIEKALRK